VARVVWFFDELFVPQTIDLGRLKVIPITGSKCGDRNAAETELRNPETPATRTKT
jgi:hypothetical protein